MARLPRLDLKRQVLANTELTLPSWVFTFHMLSPPPDPTTIAIPDYHFSQLRHKLCCPWLWSGDKIQIYVGIGGLGSQPPAGGSRFPLYSRCYRTQEKNEATPSQKSFPT